MCMARCRGEVGNSFVVLDIDLDQLQQSRVRVIEHLIGSPALLEHLVSWGKD